MSALLNGWQWVGIIFIITVLLEALIMRVYLKNTWRLSLWYSSIMNLVSFILGVGLGFLLAIAYFPLPLVIFPVYFLMMIVEFFIMKLMFSPPITDFLLLRFIVFTNLVSFFCVILVPILVDMINS